MESSFLAPGAATQEAQLASLHLSRDQQLPVILATVASKIEDEGYAEGVVTNTRFGSFPHSTLIDVPWGSQVLASKVDTGSRGRKELSQGKKRKAGAISTGSLAESAASSNLKEAIAASSGFVHVLPPTPESWTSSLPHRTQVVYTPDYSYVLHRIRARPGIKLIEAGSGSGSFTHAAARSVYNGHSPRIQCDGSQVVEDTKSHGHVYTYEFHADRHEKVRQEMKEHRLDTIVTAMHRDVYKDGFLLNSNPGEPVETPCANAVFLDLPAPWEALRHLTRASEGSGASALDPTTTVYICTFSPCIEQVQKTVSALRQYGWVDIEMVEIQHKRIDVRREYTGLQYDGMRNVNATAYSIDEAVNRLREIENRTQSTVPNGGSPKTLVEQNKQQDAAKLLYKSGRVIHRSEPELKTHTSYLVFAVLPREWSEAEEMAAARQLQTQRAHHPHPAKSQKQLKREAQQKRHLANGTKADRLADAGSTDS